MDALREWIWFDLDVIMVGPCMLCVNGRGLIWALSWLAHGCSGRGKQRQARRFRETNFAKYRKYRCIRGLRAHASTTPLQNATGATFSAAKSTKHRKYRCGRHVRGSREQHVAALDKDPWQGLQDAFFLHSKPCPFVTNAGCPERRTQTCTCQYC